MPATPNAKTSSSTTAVDPTNSYTFKEIAEWPIWNATSTLMWVLFLLICIKIFKLKVLDLLNTINMRIKSGSSMKLLSFELGELKNIQKIDPENNDKAYQKIKEGGNEFENSLNTFYSDNKWITLVHKLYHSKKYGQKYDVLVYLIPTGFVNLSNIIKVEYYLGRYFRNAVYPSTDINNKFAVLISMTGPGICIAKVYFNDGSYIFLRRYIDFEMGEYAPYQT